MTGYGQLHFDRYQLFVATYQLYGRKQWWLYPPSDTPFLYAMPYYGDWFPHYSPVEQDKPDLDRFPEFAKAKGLSVVMEPGEVLFCPRSWWHNTRNLTTSMSVAVRMVNRANLLPFLFESMSASVIYAQSRWYKRRLMRQLSRAV
jgi:ribosomal protein L16 Arg81 hydroxylase